MNIFILDTDPVKAARMQCDKHVVKMCLETAQILSTITDGVYKPTHQNHPCTLWAKASSENFDWLVAHGLALCREYTERYYRRHKCQDIIECIGWKTEKELFPQIPMTPFVQCMPEQFRQSDTVQAYRDYYHSKGFAAWNRGRPAPDWYDFSRRDVNGKA